MSSVYQLVVTCTEHLQKKTDGIILIVSVALNYGTILIISDYNERDLFLFFKM